MSILTSAMGALQSATASVDANDHNLHAYLTFVSLPISALVTALLDNPTKPIFAPSGTRSSASSLALSQAVSSTPPANTPAPQ
jgi:hypothetical protein